MKYLIPVLVGGATITVTITTAITQVHGAFDGHVSLTPYLWGYGAAAVLLVIAAVLAANVHRQEKKKDAVMPPPPPPSVVQKNIQSIDFKPEQHIHINAPDPRSARLEQEHARNLHHEKLVNDFLERHRQPDRAVPHRVEEVAPQISLTEQETADTFGRLFEKDIVGRMRINEDKWDFWYWLKHY
jgi:hypothetical protein